MYIFSFKICNKFSSTNLFLERNPFTKNHIEIIFAFPRGFLDGSSTIFSQFQDRSFTVPRLYLDRSNVHNDRTVRFCERNVWCNGHNSFDESKSNSDDDDAYVHADAAGDGNDSW